VPLLTAAPATEAVSERKAVERRPTPYAVKFQNVGTGGADYDGGNMLVEIVCRFEDQCPEQPVVGMSELGAVTRLQTDGGALFENSSGFGAIQPTIKDFKNASFLLRSKVPLRTRSLTMVNGALTVLRACDRTTLTWREPFGAAVGTTRKTHGFEFTLARFEVGNDTATVEWSCRVPPDVAAGEDPWTRRELKTMLFAADKTPLNPEAAAGSLTKLHRTFRLNHKFATTLELELISDLRRENLPFVLTAIPINGGKAEKFDGVVGQNF
jgi:hypothetical protein